MKNYHLTTYQGTPTQKKLGKVIKWSFITLFVILFAQSLRVPTLLPDQLGTPLFLAMPPLIWICLVLLGVSLVWGFVDWFQDSSSQVSSSLFADGYSVKRPILAMTAVWGICALILIGLSVIIERSLPSVSSSLFCLLPCLAIGAVMGAHMQRQRRNALQHIAAIFDHGRQAEATIIDRWVDPDGESSTRYIAYRFTVNIDGTPQDIVNREDEHEYTKSYQVGDTLPVYYLPEQPKMAMLEPHYQAARQQQA